MLGAEPLCADEEVEVVDATDDAEPRGDGKLPRATIGRPKVSPATAAAAAAADASGEEGGEDTAAVDFLAVAFAVVAPLAPGGPLSAALGIQRGFVPLPPLELLLLALRVDATIAPRIRMEGGRATTGGPETRGA